MKRAEGVVTKIVSNLYTVFADGEYREAVARGRLKLNPRSVTVGDRVVLSEENGTNVIDSVLPRKNELQRPFVANVDTAFIVIAKEPKPDLLLTDKIIVNCFKEGVTPVLVYNKCELAEDGEIDALKRAYSFIDVIAVSAKLKSGLKELESEFYVCTSVAEPNKPNLITAIAAIGTALIIISIIMAIANGTAAEGWEIAVCIAFPVVFIPLAIFGRMNYKKRCRSIGAR